MGLYPAEYEKIYTGGGPASISDPEAYKKEVHIISELLPNYIGGNHIDIACGTGFWLPFYEKKCSEITLIEQSPRMLSECRLKVKKLGIENKTKLICSDLFEYPFDHNLYDSALIGFLISHLTEYQEQSFFKILRKILNRKGEFIVLDSIWNEERTAARNKISLQRRTLNDGREFDILKRYFVKNDFNDFAKKYGLNITVVHEGRVFIASVGNVARI